MILQGRTSRRLSWWGAPAVLLGVALLPLLPTWAEPPRPPAADAPARTEAPVGDGHDQAVQRLRRLQGFCTQCHVAEAHQPVALAEGKWNQLHAEAVMMWDQLNASRPGTDRAEQIQAARDEVELLQAELEVKKAQLEVAREAARGAATHWGRLRDQALRGAVSSEVLAQAEREATGAQAQVRVKEAELKVDMVKLRQAERRLAALEGPAPDAGKRKQAEERLKTLEKQLQQLLEEKKALEQELHKGK
jgi:hypothetical protein